MIDFKEKARRVYLYFILLYFILFYITLYYIRAFNKVEIESFVICRKLSRKIEIKKKQKEHDRRQGNLILILIATRLQSDTYSTVKKKKQKNPRLALRQLFAIIQ